jgi:sigma-B regulation protein RsbU (phosphoserine phosphatase)
LGRSIATRLIALLTLCAAVIIGIGMLVDYRLSREQILGTLQRESDETIRAVIGDMENWLRGIEGATNLVARILQQRDYSQPGLQQMLRDVLSSDVDIYGATIALAPGQADSPLGFAPYYFRRNGELVYADLAAPEHNYQQQSWYREAVDAGHALWVEPYYDAGGAQVLMTTYAVPVYRLTVSGERFLYAVITADVALQELHAYLQRLHLGDSSFGILLSREGVVLSSRHRENLMRHFSATTAGQADPEGWQRMFETAIGGAVATQRLPCESAPGQCVFRLGTLQPTGWPVGVVYSEHEILAPLRDFQYKTVAIGLLTLLLMAVAVVLVSRRLTRPLAALAGASDSIARGQLDVALPTIRGDDEVARLIQSFAAMTTDLKTYIADLESATARRSRLEGELSAARDIQMAMLPGQGEASERDETFSLWARVRPARSVGGDLYNYQRRGNRLFIAVGDVSDKGAPAALFMARAMGLIQQLAATASDPAAALGALNDALEQGNDNCMFITLFLGVVDLQSQELRFASAGHTAPSLLRGGAAHAIAQQQGPALGLVAGLEYPGNSLALQNGDRLAIFTDGIDEAFNENNEMYGMERFNGELAACADAPVAAAGPLLLEAIDRFAADRPQSDDITLMLLDLKAAASATSHAPIELDRVFRLSPGITGEVHSWLEQALAQLAPAPRQDLLLAVEEVVSNIAKYAGLPPQAAVGLKLTADPRQVAVEVRDPGTAFDPLREAGRANLGELIEDASVGGLGVHLITSLTDRQSYHREHGCNILRIVKFL